MYQVIGELLPLAVGISISPLPIIAMIVLLMSPHARTSTPAFALGWMVAIVAALLLFAYLSGLELGGNGRIAIIAHLLIGSALLYLAYREWRARPKPGETGHLPHWLDAVQNMGPLAAAGLGFGIYAANPKNLTVGAAAGVAFGSRPLPLEETAIVLGVYLFVAASTVVIPVTCYFIAERRVRPWLDELRGWLTLHNAALMAVLLLVIGVLMIGKGIAALAN